MGKQYYGDRGFTLIELLIALSITLTVLIMAMQGYQWFSDINQRRLSHIESAFVKYKNFDLIAMALKGITPYMVKDKENNGFYFLGRSEGFTAVTHNAIFNPGYPAVIRVFREVSTTGDYQLVYEEASLRDNLLIDADQQLPFNHRLIVLENLPLLSFDYFGWESASVMSQSEYGASKSWFNQYDGLKVNYQPDVLRINFTDYKWEISLPRRALQYLNQTLKDV